MTHELPYSGLAYEIGSYDPDELNYESASGSIASFDNDAEDVPLKSLKVNIVPKQSGSGDPSPSNVRPISGWDEVEVVVTGTNIWDEEWELGGISDATGLPYDSSSSIRSKNYIPILPNTSYYYKSSANVQKTFYDADKRYVGKAYGYNSVFTTPSNAYFMKIAFVSAYGTTYNHDTSINYPSTDHDYHSYQGTSYTIPLPSTVYGGTLEVTSGKLTDEMRRIDLGSLNWDYLPVSSSFPYGAFYSSLYWKKYGERNFLTDCYKLSNNDFSVDKATFGNAGGNTIYIMDSSFNGDTTAFKTSLNGRYMVYERKDPTEITLTPTQVETLLGNNNIYSSCGDVEVEYIPAVEKNTFPYSGEKYYVGIFEDTEPVAMVRPINITPISTDEPIDEPIDIRPIDIRPIDEPIDDIEEEEIDKEESETDG